VSLEPLKEELEKLGYNKFKEDTRFRLLVYVPKSDRALEIQEASEKLAKFNAFRNRGASGLNAGGSLGTIEFTSSSFEGLQIAFKPDASKSLTTDEQESLAAFFSAMKFKDPKTNYAVEEFVGLPVESSFKPEELIMKASKAWIVSSKLVAETLHSRLGRSGKRYTFCQRSKSPFVTNISNKADELLKKAGHQIGLDKWNPSDMWMVNPNLLTTDFRKFESIFQLNQWIKDKYESKDLIGVSLKQVSRNIKEEEFNYPNPGQVNVEFRGLSLGKTSYFDSIDGFILYNGTASVVLRSFKPTADISGEITGKMAAGGKVGHGPLNNILKECIGPNFALTKNTEILRQYKADSVKIVKDMYKMAKPVDQRLANVKEADFLEKILSKDVTKIESYIVSKYQVTEALSGLKKATAADVECAVEKMISYASSQLEVSSVFLKLSEK